MSKLELFESSPYVFTQKFVEAVKEGYRLQNTNEGYVQDCVGNGGWVQVLLHKDDNYETISAQFAQVGSYVIEEYDRQAFFRSVQSHALNAAEFNFNSLQYDVRGIKMIKCVIRPTESYTREQLESLEWSVIKDLGYKYNCFNRARTTLENSLVRVFEEV